MVYSVAQRDRPPLVTAVVDAPVPSDPVLGLQQEFWCWPAGFCPASPSLAASIVKREIYLPCTQCYKQFTLLIIYKFFWGFGFLNLTEESSTK